MPNQIRVEGNLGKDSVLRFTPDGSPVLNFSIAADQQSRRTENGDWEQTGPTLWLDTELWGDQAEPVHEKAVKGARLIVFGHIRCETWNDRETGETRYRTKLKADAVKVLPPRGQGGPQRGPERPQGAAQGNQWGNTPQGGGTPYNGNPGGGFGADDPAPF